MAVDGLAFYLENYVGEGWVVDNCPHVAYQTVDCLVVDFGLFQLADVQDADVVEPLASVETTEDE